MPEYLYRRNTVLEALRGSRRALHRLWLQEGLRDAGEIVAEARARRVPVETAAKHRLGQLAGDSSHQGVVLEVGPYPYSAVDDILALAAGRQEKPFLLLLDLLHGPQNIGALLRAAEACGVHGVVVQDRRAPEITSHVVIYSAGAAEHLLIAQVTNLAQTIQQLQAAGVWIVGLDLSEEARLLGQVDLDLPLGLVVGHEGGGLRRLVRDRCDFLLRLPMRGRVASLNAATAGAIALYAAWQARGFSGAPAYQNSDGD
ncbi:MAG: 23S rRNA (guanosine(2251)-2'-O)-methyltransferase RlmB [Chloroflexi bacterium]|nr:23S rRNA (guanosine(2251)-2'-O)-methyltransferase RlmB [Chloroflexota bacterium]MCI0579615.1 23S rRNA (guanosine(2251)-2'-O)-methyltransferase RlmB [Chloroflexota bacterium]MCI0644824.1 23S rRNA (guanosine(2251)-2'-O)-methyltransferase RlmB [Chloroflexota bacterium]MCI0731450.1 23S rRNA (guanosine(2251)-2'-O)-methyltransferase RlmB [Chloroflexota bacterium]